MFNQRNKVSPAVIWQNEVQNNSDVIIDMNEVTDESSTAPSEQSKAQVFLRILREFCSNSSIHGLRYFSERNINWVERTWWISTFTLSLGLCMYSVSIIWSDWKINPVILAFDHRTKSIEKIPFPAVTICPTEKFSYSKLDVEKLLGKLTLVGDNTSHAGDITSDDMNKMDLLWQICRRGMTRYRPVTGIPRTQSIYKTIEEIAQDYNVAIETAAFRHENIKLQPLFTGQGLCYTFNMLDSKDIYTDQIRPELFTVKQELSKWNIENVDDPDSDNDYEYPYHVDNTDTYSTLVLQLNTPLNNTNRICDKRSLVFRIAFHAPDELPQITHRTFHMAMGQNAAISIKPDLMMTANPLRSYLPKLRGCYFKFERKLRFFKTYSFNKCIQECTANETRRTCNCTPFHSTADVSTPVCTSEQLECYRNTHMKLSEQCDCLPDCFSLKYNIETSITQMLLSEAVLNGSENRSSYGVSYMTISFADTHFTALTRTETYTLSRFFAASGGLMGLFMGISLLSIIEMIYFCTIKLFYAMKRQRFNNESVTTWAQRIIAVIDKRRKSM